jgi:hypothetical protein
LSWKSSILYILLVIAIAGISALTGAIAGGAVVYRALQQPGNLPAPIEEVLPSEDITPGQTLTLNTLFEFQPGDQITLDVMRGNENIQVQVTLGEA